MAGGLRCPRMGILFIRIWRLVNHQEHKVNIVGLDDAGKTTILYQFSMNEIVHTSPTKGSNVEEIVVNNTHFLMWDIGGQESLRSSGTLTILTRVCNSCGQHRQRKNFWNQRRALQNASPRGPKKSWVADFCY